MKKFVVHLLDFFEGVNTSDNSICGYDYQ